MIVSEGQELGSGSVRYAWSPEDEPQEMFGLDLNNPVRLPLDLLAIGVGGIVAIFGTALGNKAVDVWVRIMGGASALLGLVDLIKTSVKGTVDGLDSEWAPEDTRDSYLNRFYHAIDTTKDLSGFGQIEYWIIDPEEPNSPLIRTQCAPFIVGPGLEVVRKGAKGGNVEGFGSLGFWEVLDPSGMQVAVMQCRPHYTQDDLSVKQVTRGREILRTRGSAEYPEGTMRSRRGMLFTTRR